MGGSNALQAMVTNHPAHNSAILLFDPRLVILVVWPREREFDSVVGAILHQGLVDKLAAIVDVERSQNKRQCEPDPIK